MKLPTPLDRLDPARIPAEERRPSQPKELVAVLGESRLRHNGTINRVVVSPDGKLVASGSDGAIRLWDAATLAERGSLSGDLIDFLANGQLTLHNGEQMQIWDVTVAPPKQLRSHSVADPWRLAVSRDGTRLATIHERGESRYTIHLWDASGDKLMGPTELSGHTAYVEAAVFSPDGKTLASFSQDKTIRVWDLSGDKPRERAVLKRTGASGGWDFSPDGKLLAASLGDKTVKVWDLSGAEVMERASFEIQTTRKWDNAISITFTPDGKALACGVFSTGLQLWDVSGAAPRLLSALPGSRIGSLAFAPNGQTLFGCQGITMRAWSIAGNAIKEQTAHRGHTAGILSLDFSPDGKTLLSAGYDDTVRLWDLTAEVPRERHVLPGAGWKALFAPDGKRFAAGTQGPILYDLSGETPKQLFKFTWHSHGPVGMAFGGDGKQFVIGNAWPQIQLWDLSGPEPTKRLEMNHKDPSHTMDQVALSPDGRLLASGRHTNDHTLRLWRIEGDQLEQVAIPRVEALHVLFAPDGKTLAFGDHNGGVHLWDLTGPIPTDRQRLSGSHPIAFTRDGRQLLTLGHEGAVIVWDPATGQKLHEVKLAQGVGAAALSADGRHFAVGNSNGTIYILRIME
jgi:WD40 repeat protein